MAAALPTLLDLLRRFAAERPDALALTFEDARHTYADLDARSSRLANGLLERGVRGGDRVAILARNHPAFYELAFACMKAGAMMTPLNWRLSQDEVDAILADAEPRLLLHDPDFDVASPSAASLRLDRAFDDWRDTRPAVDPRRKQPADDPCLLLYTSGTTGRPKGVMITPANLAFVERTAREAWGFSSSSVNIVAMPLFHIGGIGYGMMALSQGGATVLLRQPDPAQIIAAARTHGATHGFFVPTVLERILDHLDRGGGPAPTSLQRVVYGAAPIAKPVLERAISLLGCGFDHAYGMTETAGTVVTMPPHDHLVADEARLRAIGRPLPFVQIRIVDPATGAEVAAGDVGEILVRSEMVAKGYWRQPETTAKTIDAQGWLHTGDAAIADADGYLTIVDRYKDMIVSGGENVYPREIENVLLAHPDVGDAAVIGIPDARWGETPAAFVVPSPGAAPDPDDLRAYTRKRLAHYKCPSRFTIVSDLPRNASGKVLKGEMRKPEWWSK